MQKNINKISNSKMEYFSQLKNKEYPTPDDFYLSIILFSFKNNNLKIKRFT